VDDLPPDLSRLGQDLTWAVSRSLRREQWRRRLRHRVAAVGASGALIFMAMTPALLQPAIVAIDAWTRLPLENTQTVAWLCDSPPHTPAPVCGGLPHVADPRAAIALDHWTPARRSAQFKGSDQPAIGP
jgi:hypothetical protein